MGDAISSIFQFAWRGLLLFFALIFSVAFYGQYLEPALFPPLEEQVEIEALYDDGSDQYLIVSEQAFVDHRCEPDYPVKVVITNNSRETIERFTFDVWGYPEGRSTNQVRNGYHESDYIIPPDEMMAFCVTILTDYGIDPSSLRYEATISSAIGEQD